MLKGQVKTAIFPVAGMGTRFLPITKSIPKEMLTMIDKPLIQYAVEEAIEAGIEKLIFVTAGGKRAIEDYFDSNYELESRLQALGKEQALHQVQDILPDHVTFCYVRQKNPRGLGDAILTARDIVGQEPFAVLLADDLMTSSGSNVMAQMTAAYQDNHSAMMAVEQVAKEETHKYGIVDADNQGSVSQLVEKPAPHEAPSQLAIVGRYILPPRIFSLLENTKPGKGGEVQITDAISSLLPQSTVQAFPFQGKRFDCGSREGYFKALLHFAKRDEKLLQILQQATSPEAVMAEA